MRRWTVMTLVAVLACASLAAVGQAKKRPFVYVPFSKLTLSDEQAEKISAIQHEIRAQIKALQEQEYQRCEALLNDAQRDQLAEMEAERREKARKRAKAYRERKKREREAAAAE